MIHYTAEDAARVSAEHPGCVVFEVITASFALLMTAPASDKAIASMPLTSMDMLDNASLDIRQPVSA